MEHTDYWHACYADARDRGYDKPQSEAMADRAQRYSKDAAGHEHASSGKPEGGQFTGKAEHGQTPDDMANKVAGDAMPKVGDMKGTTQKGWKVTGISPAIAPHVEIDSYRGTRRNVEGRPALIFAEEYEGGVIVGGGEFDIEDWESLGSSGNDVQGADQYADDNKPERGPWKKRSPHHAIASAANRLQSLAEHASEYDDDEIADVVGEIAEHFDAEDFKQAARRFGCKSGQTKAEICKHLVTQICGKRETSDAVTE